jgi:hypothetical protein
MTTLAEYVNAPAADAAFVTECEAEAAALVDNRIGAVATVPVAVRDKAVLEVAADLYWRRSSRNGIAGLDAVEVAPLRINRDPMAAATPILAPFLGPVIA